MASIEKIREMSREYAMRALPEGVSLKKHLTDARAVVRKGRKDARKIEQRTLLGKQSAARAAGVPVPSPAPITGQQLARVNKRDIRRQLPGFAVMVADKLNAMGFVANPKYVLKLARNLSLLTGRTRSGISKEKALELFRGFINGSVVPIVQPANPIPRPYASPTPPNPLNARAVFYASREWREIRYQRFKISGRKCVICQRGDRDGIVLHVDHIKPRSKYPELELDLDNTQVLCEDCNLGKSNKDETDWRETTSSPSGPAQGLP